MLGPASPCAAPSSFPLWLAVLLAILAAWAALDRLLIPSVRWFLRRRVNRVLEEINTRLKIRIPPFKLTKREVLIDRLLYDPQVQQAVEAEAREKAMPREVVMARVHRYAREIVPAFNAYVYFRVGYWLARNDRALALPGAPRLRGRGRPRGDPAAGDGRLPHQPPQQHGLRPRLVSRGGEGRALLRRRRVGAHLAAADARSARWAPTSCGATRRTRSTARSSSATSRWRRRRA